MIGGVDPKVFLVRFYDDCEQEVLAVKVQAETAEHAGTLFDLTSPPSREVLMVEEIR